MPEMMREDITSIAIMSTENSSREKRIMEAIKIAITIAILKVDVPVCPLPDSLKTG